MSPIAPPFPPNSDQVALAWLAQRVPGITAGQVAAALPALASWAAEGFVTAGSIPGTQPNIDVPIRKPVIQVDTWGANPDSGKPHWPKAFRLAELIRIATESGQIYGKPVILPGDYLDVRVQSVYLLSDPNRVNGDPSGYAHVTLDLALDWVPA